MAPPFERQRLSINTLSNTAKIEKKTYIPPPFVRAEFSMNLFLVMEVKVPSVAYIAAPENVTKRSI
jgi:hypothetical protein